MLRSLRVGLRRLVGNRRVKAAGPETAAVPRLGTITLWCHAQTEIQASALIELAERLRRDIDELTVLLTHPGPQFNGREIQRPDLNWLTLAPLSDSLIGEKQPDLAVIAGLVHPYSPLDHMVMKSAPMILADADHPGAHASRAWRRKSTLRERLRDFRHVFARDEAAAPWVAAQIDDQTKLEAQGPLRLGVAVPQVDPDTRGALTLALASRPVWLAAGCPTEELDAVAQAHRAALRGTHRLLLAYLPAAGATAEDLIRRFQGHNLRTDLQSRAGYPDTQTQVFILDSETDPTLWYHMSPVTFMGGTLSALPGLNPYFPASLGSAVISGIAITAHRAYYSALTASDALRSVRSDTGLKAAVPDLIVPHKAAAQVGKAVELTTRGADVVDRMQEILTEMLEDIRDGVP